MKSPRKDFIPVIIDGSFSLCISLVVLSENYNLQGRITCTRKSTLSEMNTHLLWLSETSEALSKCSMVSVFAICSSGDPLKIMT